MQAHPMTAHCVDELMSRVERRETVAQAADERIQSLVRYARGLFLAPNNADKVAAADDLSLMFV